MRRRTLVAGLAAIALVAGVWTARSRLTDEPAAERTPTARRGFADGGAASAQPRARDAQLPSTASAPPVADGNVRISGSVIELDGTSLVGGVEVVFRGVAGEASTIARADGSYTIEVPAGIYRAFVRDDAVLSVGLADPRRVPGPPSADTANAPDEALMPVVVATRDAAGIELSVVRSGKVVGRVVDGDGRPIANALLHAASDRRPTLGTDLAESAADGSFEMQVPAGRHTLEVTHARYAGLAEAIQVDVLPGDTARLDVTLVAGCIISGRVLGPRGVAANEGAIERQWGYTDLEFAPSGRIEPDGTFRWTAMAEGDVVLRAWPWKSAPSSSQQFSCRDGARFERVVFEVPDRAPDIEGVLRDASGSPVAFAYLDLAPLDYGGIAQQERTDANGQFAVFHMPAGRYLVTAHVPGRGIVSSTITSPQRDVALALSGTGRLEGTTTFLANGSFELALGACFDGGPLRLPRDPRLVVVTNHQFTVDDLPACDLQVAATWRDQSKTARVMVSASGVTQLELPIGPPRAKTVDGVVRDGAGRPVAGAEISGGDEDATADAAGRFTVTTVAGAWLTARGARGQSGSTEVGLANVEREQVDIILEDRESYDDDSVD